jgi:hypothetical protein
VVVQGDGSALDDVDRRREVTRRLHIRRWESREVALAVLGDGLL